MLLHGISPLWTELPLANPQFPVSFRRLRFVLEQLSDLKVADGPQSWGKINATAKKLPQGSAA
jgi:hypothetical protein